jgi:hypothetical protein
MPILPFLLAILPLIVLGVLFTRGLFTRLRVDSSLEDRIQQMRDIEPVDTTPGADARIDLIHTVIHMSAADWQMALDELTSANELLYKGIGAAHQRSEANKQLSAVANHHLAHGASTRTIGEITKIINETQPHKVAAELIAGLLAAYLACCYPDAITAQQRELLLSPFKGALHR